MLLYACSAAGFLQADNALKLVSRGAGVISPQAPAYRKGAKLAVTFTRQHVTYIIREVCYAWS